VARTIEFVVVVFFVQGLNFLSSTKSELDDRDDVDETERKMWEILTYVAYIDTHKAVNRITDNEQRIADGLLKELKHSISGGKAYPCSYLYLFRSALLDRNQTTINVRHPFLRLYREIVYGFVFADREANGTNWPG